ncbi:FAD-dependent oxidoreductase [Shumkonia mesophila]|uniref:FAD-dependent oxidoreductase n=1 Tax=Shumkonia mesophila TaxID=2838854 RepID=UPI00293529FB|nr:FAD-dependent oxidoreductase [Shumkonia mesophila]
MTPAESAEFDTLVLGAGIAGLQTALDLADQGFKVAIVERDPSIGGKMIRLSKVFPTLDCASCITTPKMAAAAHHDNITLFTLCELDKLVRDENGLVATVKQKPRYVDIDLCTGCRECEYACPTFVPDHEQGGFTSRKAIYVPFSNAVPQKAVMDPENCWICGKEGGQCFKVCPTGAINYFDKPSQFTLRARTAVLATGYELIPDYTEKAFGPAGRQPNLITSLQMERLLAPHGPYMRVLRPSDGKEPESIAFIQCAGSRDLTLGVPYCSRVCCMYSIKQAMLLSGALPMADITIYYMDIRAFGKNYEQFYQNAKAMGVEFVKAKPTVVGTGENGGVVVRYEDQEGGGGGRDREHDLVVQALAIVPAWNPTGIVDVGVAEDGFLQSVHPKFAPTLTRMEGVFTAGVAIGPKDIVDTIIEAGAAAMEVSNYLTETAKPATVDA